MSSEPSSRPVRQMMDELIVAALAQEIDARVYRLCGLTKDEIRVVEDSVGVPKGGAKS